MKKTSTKLHAAAQLCVIHHDGQNRKHAVNGVALPYAAHPFEVMKKLWTWNVYDEDMLAAALLHDTLEDSDILPGTISDLGEKVLQYVQEMTFVKPKGASKDEIQVAKADYMATFAEKSIESLVIKLADRFCNVMDYWGNMRTAMEYFMKADVLYETFQTRYDEVVERFGETTAHIIRATVKGLRLTYKDYAMNEGSCGSTCSK